MAGKRRKKEEREEKKCIKGNLDSLAQRAVEGKRETLIKVQTRGESDKKRP